MHSRILVLNDSDYDCERIYEDMSTYGNSVDYVCESEASYESDYKWVMAYLRDMGFFYTKNEDGFVIESIENFWDKMTKDVNKILTENMGRIAKENRWFIEDRVAMKHEFWIWYDNGLWTLPYFMEYVAKQGEEYKITKFLDYHF